MATAHEKRHHEAVHLDLAILWEENHKSEMTLGGSNMAARMTYTLVCVKHEMRSDRNDSLPGMPFHMPKKFLKSAKWLWSKPK